MSMARHVAGATVRHARRRWGSSVLVATLDGAVRHACRRWATVYKRRALHLLKRTARVAAQAATTVGLLDRKSVV